MRNYRSQIAMGVLASLVDRLRGESPFWRAPKPTAIVRFSVRGEIIGEKALSEIAPRIADQLLIQIREHGYETFAELPAVANSEVAIDPETGMCVRLLNGLEGELVAEVGCA